VGSNWLEFTLIVTPVQFGVGVSFLHDEKRMMAKNDNPIIFFIIFFCKNKKENLKVNKKRPEISDL